MTDQRRTRWVAHDVYFLEDSLGTDLFDRLGAAGLALWLGFIAACKKNHIEGEITYSSEAEALALLGLPGMPLANSHGDTFTLEDFFDVLGDHKVTRRSRRARRLKVVCTRWERWQHGARSQKAAERKRRSAPQTTRQMSGGNPEDARSDTDTDTDTDSKNSSPPDGGGVQHPSTRELTKEFARLVRANGHPVPDAATRANASWLQEMDRLLRIGPPGWDGEPPTPDEVSRVARWCAEDEFEKANVRSVPKFRERYSQLRLKALVSSRGPALRAVGSHEHEDGTF